jgi:hypothetical protein
MAGGFAKDGAVQDQIDATVEDAIKRARDELPKGESLNHCAECGNDIPEARREAVPGVGPPRSRSRRSALCQLPGRTRRGAKSDQRLQSQGQQRQSVEVITQC